MPLHTSREWKRHQRNTQCFMLLKLMSWETSLHEESFNDRSYCSWWDSTVYPNTASHAPVLQDQPCDTLTIMAALCFRYKTHLWSVICPCATSSAWGPQRSSSLVLSAVFIGTNQAVQEYKNMDMVRFRFSTVLCYTQLLKVSQKFYWIFFN